nr:HAD family hydrolase [Qipengyuania sp. S6317L1]
MFEGQVQVNKAVVFDVGRVLFGWQLRALFEKIIADKRELEWFVDTVVTEEWHFQHDRGRALDDMVAERIAQFPAYANHIKAYRERFNETITGPIAGVHPIVHELNGAGVPLYCLTNFGHELWHGFRPSQPIFDVFEDIVVSGTEQIAKPQAGIYEIVEERSGREGADLFFTDDNADNIAAAKQRGWDAHLFTDAPTLRAQLEASGFL